MNTDSIEVDTGRLDAGPDDDQPGEDWFLENTVPLPPYRPERLY